MMNRRKLLLLLGGAMSLPRGLRAQLKAMPVIGVLRSGSRDPNLPFAAAFRQGLSEIGYVEGQNVAIEYCSVERYDRLPDFIADLVGSGFDVIATSGMPSALAAKSATSTIPIVFIVGTDPGRRGPHRQPRPARRQSHGHHLHGNRADAQAA